MKETAVLKVNKETAIIKDENNISKFAESEVLLEMHKNRSPIAILFIADAEDSYLIHVIKCKAKTGDISQESMIIQPDMETRISACQRDGFIINWNYGKIKGKFQETRFKLYAD